MSNNNNNSQNGGIGFFGLLTIVLITLKLTEVIAWSWWWVLAPLWLPIAIFLAIIIVSAIVARIATGNSAVKGQKKRKADWKTANTPEDKEKMN